MNNLQTKLKIIGDNRKHLENDAHAIIQDLVSVCMPNYNKGEHIYRAIQSIAQQTYNNIEICIVDDCSTDNSVNEISRALKDFSIPHQLVCLPKRVGNAWAQNLAYYLSKGEYLANMDSDDISNKIRIEKLLQHLKDVRADLVGSSYSKFDEKGADICKTNWNGQIKTLQFGTCMFTKEVINQTGGLDKAFIGTEDYGFLQKVQGKGFSFEHLNKCLYFYRQTSTQRSKLFHSSLV